MAAEVIPIRLQKYLKEKIVNFFKLNASLIATAAYLSACPSYSAITELSIQAIRPYGTFAPGQFVRIDGEAHGKLALTETIADIDKAPRDANGQVSYRTRFTLIMPAETAKGNGALLVDVVNRGQPISHMFYNSPRGRPIRPGLLPVPWTPT